MIEKLFNAPNKPFDSMIERERVSPRLTNPLENCPSHTIEHTIGQENASWKVINFHKWNALFATSYSQFNCFQTNFAISIKTVVFPLAATL